MSFLTLGLTDPIPKKPKIQKVNNQKVGVDGEFTGPSAMVTRRRISFHDEDLSIERIYAALIAARGGNPVPYLDLAEALEMKDPQWRTATWTRRVAPISVPLEIVTAGADEKEIEAADLVRKTFSGDWTADLTVEMMDAPTKGYAIHEILWTYNGKYHVPIAVKQRDPRFFRFGAQNPEEIYYVGPNGDESLRLADYPHNFIVHIPKNKSGHPIDGGTAPVALYYGFFKNQLIKFQLNHAEKYGSPARFAKYKRGTPPKKVDQLVDMLVSMGHDGVGAFEEGIDLTILEGSSHSNSSGQTLYESPIRYCDEMMTKLQLGQTLTSDTGQGKGSYALGAVHHATRIDVLKSDTRGIANTLNRSIIRSIVWLNIGPIENYPYARFNVRENIDVQVQMNALATAVSLGGQFPITYLNELLSVRFPKPDEEIMEVVGEIPEPQGSLSGGGSPAGTGKGSPADQQARKARAAGSPKNPNPEDQPTSSQIKPGQDGPDRADLRLISK